MPTPAPMIVASEIGVSITRSAPKSLLQALVLAEDAAAADVLAEHDDARVGVHLALHGQRGGLGVAQCLTARGRLLQSCRHWPAPVVCTSVKAAPGSGQGAASAAASAASTSACASCSIASSAAPAMPRVEQPRAGVRDRIGLERRGQFGRIAVGGRDRPTRGP